MNKLALPLIACMILASGCDQVAGKLGLENPAVKESRLDAEGKAVGSACRHSGRAIEDCYSIYGWLPKASIYNGWRDMDEYMRSNQIETIAPQLPPPEPPTTGRTKKKKAVAEEATNNEAAAIAATEKGSEAKTADAPAKH